MKWIEKIISPIPMYQVVGSTLSVLILAAGVCAVFGVVSFSPLALIVSTVMFVGVSVISSYGLGRIYGTYSHLRSALITGLILACLFTPTIEVITLAQYALIAVIAQSSKFIVTYKKRHIFNPAAFGAVIGGLLQLSYASWWIATPPLFALILIGAFAVLYKTRHLSIAVVFLAICLPIGLIKGVDMWVLFASWPLLFMLGFMVTEPNTLPPRRRQTYLVAAVIALSVSIPFAVGDILFSTPELAIIVGNVVAFMLAFQQRRDLGLQFMSRRSLTPTVDELIFSTNHPVSFEPGQYIELTVPHNHQDVRGTRRFFSVTSRPDEKQLRVGVKFFESGSSFKQQLRQLKKGQAVQSTGITGDFVLPHNTEQKIVMIAGGIGITPFISQIQSIVNMERDAVLLYFAREPREFAYRELLDGLPVKVHYFVAEHPDSHSTLAPVLTSEILETTLDDLGERNAYISGPPQMVEYTKTLLRGKVKHVKTDHFSGY